VKKIDKGFEKKLPWKIGCKMTVRLMQDTVVGGKTIEGMER